MGREPRWPPDPAIADEKEEAAKVVEIAVAGKKEAAAEVPQSQSFFSFQ